jgi:hypothetical protein
MSRFKSEKRNEEEERKTETWEAIGSPKIRIQLGSFLESSFSQTIIV